MSAYSLELPTIQNWSCHNCGGCCRQHGVMITAAEKQRIVEQQWTPADGIPASQPLFVEMGGITNRWQRLAHQPDGACVFLDEKGLCRIHGKFGEEAKPLACRIYPYAFHPKGNSVVVGLRFSCPSVTANLGKPISQQRQELKELVQAVVPGRLDHIPAPFVTQQERTDWPDFLKVVKTLDGFFTDSRMPFITSLLRALAFIELLRQSRLQKLKGSVMNDFLDLIQAAAEAVIPAQFDVLTARRVFHTDILERGLPVVEPSRISKTQFRLLAGQYARKDTYATADGTWRGRWNLLRTALRLTRGRGTVPPLQEAFREVPFTTLEKPFGGLPAGADELFGRYFRVKLQALSFCGPAYYDVSLVEGFCSLALVFPSVLWIARWLAVSAGRESLTDDDVRKAVTIADHHHGYSPAFGTWGFRRRVRNLMHNNEIAKLCLWYQR